MVSFKACGNASLRVELVHRNASRSSSGEAHEEQVLRAVAVDVAYASAHRVVKQVPKEIVIPALKRSVAAIPVQLRGAKVSANDKLRAAIRIEINKPGAKRKDAYVGKKRLHGRLERSGRWASLLHELGQHVSHHGVDLV